MVAIVLLPLAFDAATASVRGRYDALPNNAIHVYSELRRASLTARVINLEHRFHDRTLPVDALLAELRDALRAVDASHVVVPISVTESYNEFRNVDLELLRRVFDAGVFQRRDVVLTGRVLDEERLRRDMVAQYMFVPTSYDEGGDIARYVLGAEPARRELPLDDALEREFRLGDVLAARDRGRAVIVYGQRGCPYRCTFCERSLIWPESRVLRLELSETIATMRFYRDRYARRRFMLLDPLFNADLDYVDAFCDAVAPLDVEWHAELRVDRIDAPRLARMKRAGCFRILFGIETFDEAIARKVHKTFDRERAIATIEACAAVGITPWLSFIAGLGDGLREAYDGIRHTTDVLLRHRLGHADCVPYFLYEGTRAHDEAFGSADRGVFPRCFHPFSIVAMADMVALFGNRVHGNEVVFRGVAVRCLRELFERMWQTGSFEAPSGLGEALGRTTRYGLFFQAILAKPPDQLRAIAERLLGEHRANAPRRRVVPGDDYALLGLPSAALPDGL